MTPAQCRAARAMFRIKRDTLAHEAGVSVQLIDRFENERPNSNLRRTSLDKLRGALEAAGAVFMNGAVEGVGQARQ